jgi:hypothetical protein
MMMSFKSCSGGMGKMLKENPGVIFTAPIRLIDPPVKPIIP